MTSQYPTLPWTPGGPGERLVLARLYVAVEAAGLQVVWQQQLVAAGEQGLAQAVSGRAPCSQTPSSACIDPPASERNNEHSKQD